MLLVPHQLPKKSVARSAWPERGTGGCLEVSYRPCAVVPAHLPQSSPIPLLHVCFRCRQFLGLYPLLDSLGLQNDRVTDASCVYDKSSGRFLFSLLWAVSARPAHEPPASGTGLCFLMHTRCLYGMPQAAEHMPGGEQSDTGADGLWVGVCAAPCCGAQSQGQPSPWDRLGQGQYGSGIAIGVSAYRNPVKPWNIFFIPTTCVPTTAAPSLACGSGRNQQKVGRIESLRKRVRAMRSKRVRADGGPPVAGLHCAGTRGPDPTMTPSLLSTTQTPHSRVSAGGTP